MASLAAAAVSIVLGAGAQVEFADPADAMFRALYPSIDTRTGLTPVAEPAVASGREPARVPREGCVPGFRIAAPRVEKWPAAGATTHIAHFLVTTDSPRGAALPCYRPEAWVCVLDRAAAGWAPIDCARVEQDHVMSDGPSIDTAPFRLNEAETAFGVRLRHKTAYRTEDATDEVLVLFRLHERRLTQVLAVPIAREETDYTGGGECARALVVNVDKTRTAGFFDWRVATGRRRGGAECAVDPDPTGRYRWDGRRYLKE